MKINKYLKELGFEWYDMPGVFSPKLEKDENLDHVAAADCRNKEDKEGFCDYEFFSLDNTLSLFIYSKLCYFREYIAPLCTPGCLTPNKYNWENDHEREQANKAAHDKWLSILDKMILAFKIDLIGPREGYEGIDREAKREGMQLFIEYYSCLWY